MTITKQHVELMMRDADIVWQQMFGKTLIGICRLKNGFVIVESVSSVSPASFSEDLGREIIMKRFESKIWELESYSLTAEEGDIR